MRLYLVRHAHAVPEEEDIRRPLSARGRKTVRQIAAFFHASGVLQPCQVWHSPLWRARETAEILARGLGLSRKVLEETSGLLPDDDPTDIVRRLASAGEDLALVGHEPHLGALATRLVCGKGKPPVFAFKKGAVLCLEHADAGWQVRWHFSPELLAKREGLMATKTTKNPK
ncbi:MAG TPA: phosphohistidine phosphatase SixA [Opitutaceae bacterium]|nr:phosphohistidine phosphatase SixA [Opitutaceae bacterium]